MYIENINQYLKENNRNFICIKYAGNVSNKSTFKCLIDGYEWVASFDNIKYSKTGCPKCFGKVRIKTINEVNHYLLSENKTIICLYYGGTVPAKSKFKCLMCNYEWQTSFYSIKTMNSGCPKCKDSKGERAISNFLSKNNIDYIYQKKFNDCKNKKQLIFDFYISHLNICIEYQGEQHYKPIDFAGRGDIWARKLFESNKKRDLIKQNYCKGNNIYLLIISYDQIDKIDKILSKHVA